MVILTLGPCGLYKYDFMARILFLIRYLINSIHVNDFAIFSCIFRMHILNHPTSWKKVQILTKHLQNNMKWAWFNSRFWEFGFVENYFFIYLFYLVTLHAEQSVVSTLTWMGSGPYLALLVSISVLNLEESNRGQIQMG